MGLIQRFPSFGDYDRREFDVVVNAPLLESLAGKVSFAWKDDGGEYMRNDLNRRGENAEDRIALSASILWQLRDTLTLHYIYDLEEDGADTPALVNLNTDDDLVCINSADGETCGTGTRASVEHTAQNFSNNREYDGDYHTLRLDLDLRGFDVTAITGLRNTEELSHQDLDASQADFYSVTRDQQYDQFSQEVTFNKQHSDALSYSFGIYLFDSSYSLFQEEFYTLDILNDAGLACCFVAGDILRLSSKQDANLQSAFAHFTYVLDDRWTFDAGLRLNKFKKDFRHLPEGYRTETTEVPSLTGFVGHQTWEEATPTAGLAYRVDEEAMIYLRYSTGYLPGAYDENATSLDTAEAIDVQTSASWELGMNSEWLNDKLRLNMSYYQIDYDGKIEQFAMLTSSGSVDMRRDNVADIRLDGFELEFEATPLANLYIRGAYSHIDANFEEYFVPDLANPGTSIDLSGLQPHRAPPDSLYVSFRYSKALAKGTLRTYAGYRLYADYQTNALLPAGKVHNWTTWDLSIDYVVDEWTLRLFSQNVKNKRYLQNISGLTQGELMSMDGATTTPTPLMTFAEYNQPRYTGFEIIYSPDLTKLLSRW